MALKKRTLKTEFEGFWIRFVANIIDSIIILSAYNLLLYLFLNLNTTIGTSFWKTLVFAMALCTVIDAVYEIFLTYKFGGTVGKLLLGMKVVDNKNHNISLGLSIGRYFGKYISFLALGIGFFMIGWTKNKQGIHDMMCNTYVTGTNNQWRKRRWIVISITVIIILGYIAYSIIIGIKAGISSVEIRNYAPDPMNPIEDIVKYCDAKSGMLRDNCYADYIQTEKYFKYVTLTSRLNLCNNITSKSTKETCIQSIAIDERSPTICERIQSTYYANQCKRNVGFLVNMGRISTEEYDLSGFNSTLEYDSIRLGYIRDNECITNEYTEYIYGDETCFLAQGVRNFKKNEDDFYWTGYKLDVLRENTTKPITVSKSIYEDKDKHHLLERGYDSIAVFNSSTISPGRYTLTYEIYDLIGKQKVTVTREISILEDKDYGNLTVKSFIFGSDTDSKHCTPVNSSTFEKYPVICLKPKVSGFQKAPDGFNRYNFDLEIRDINGKLYNKITDVLVYDRSIMMLDDTLNDRYITADTQDYPSGNYTITVTIKDIVSRKKVDITKNFTII